MTQFSTNKFQAIFHVGSLNRVFVFQKCMLIQNTSKKKENRLEKGQKIYRYIFDIASITFNRFKLPCLKVEHKHPKRVNLQCVATCISLATKIQQKTILEEVLKKHHSSAKLYMFCSAYYYKYNRTLNQSVYIDTCLLSSIYTPIYTYHYWVR